jgi:hypothetical protein
MPHVVPLNWSGSFGGYGGPLASGESHHWWGNGVFGDANRFYLITASCEGAVAAEISVRNLSHYRRTDSTGRFVDETHFDIHNNGSAEPVYYYFYVAWSTPINV